MIDIEQEEYILEQAMAEYYDKKSKKRNIPKEIIIFSVNDMW